MRKLVGGSLQHFTWGPVAGLVFTPYTRQRRARRRILGRRKRRARWLTQQAAFFYLDSQYKYIHAASRRAWGRWGRRYHRTAYAQFMSFNMSRVLRGQRQIYNAFIARYGYLVPSTWPC